jgi:hypothetical protein
MRRLPRTRSTFAAVCRLLEAEGRRGTVLPGFRPAAAVGLLLLAGCLTSPVPPAGLPARHAVKSDQLLVLSDFKLSPNDALILELQEMRRQVYEELLIPRQDRRVVVYLFSDEEQYSGYMQSSYPDLPPRRAFFIGSPSELAVYAYWGLQVRVDLRHEYTHGLLHASLKNVPLWLDEGIAEYFEVPDAGPQRINVEHAQRLTTAVQNGWRPDLRRLEDLQSVNEMHRLDYQEAWAWVHFMMHESPESRSLLLGYIETLQSSTPPDSFAELVAANIPHADDRMLGYVSGFFMPHMGSALGDHPKAAATPVRAQSES